MGNTYKGKINNNNSIQINNSNNIKMVSTHTYDSSSNNIITRPVQQFKQREKKESTVTW